MKLVAYIATCVSAAILIASMLYGRYVALYAVLLLPFATTLLAFHTRGDVQLWSIAVAFCLNALGASVCLFLIVNAIAVAATQSIAGFVQALHVIFYWFLPFRNLGVAFVSFTTLLNVWALTRLWKSHVSMAA